MATLEDINQQLKDANEGNTNYASLQESFQEETLNLLDDIKDAVIRISSIGKASVSELSPAKPENLAAESPKGKSGISIADEKLLKSNKNSLEALKTINKSIVKMHKMLNKSFVALLKQDKVFIDKQTKDDKKKGRLASIASLANPKNLTKKLGNMMPKMPKMPKLSGMLKGISGIGLAGGAVMGGAGLLAIGGSELLKTMQDIDATKITKNIKELLTIGDMFEGGGWEFLKEGGAFFGAMTGIGLGLAAFALGSGVAASVDFFTKDSKWAQGVVDNVTTLLTLSSEEGAVKTLGEGFALGTALGTIGLGIAAFSLGQGVATAVAQFDGGKWAQGIVDNVKTLLTLGDGKILGMVSTLGEGFALGAALGAIGGGIAAFGIGEGVQTAIAQFDGGNWAQGIVDNVTTLLSIGDGKFGMAGILVEAALFAPSMGFLAAGLVAFSGGEMFASIISAFDGGNWAQGIVDNVTTLLSIGDGKFGMAGVLVEAALFAPTMAALAAGLIAFSAGEAVAAITQFASKDDWAQTIKDNVKTLLSITDLEGMTVKNVSVVGLTLSALGTGLAAFGIGQNITGLAQMMSDDDWVAVLKKNVSDLISIPNDLPEDAHTKTLSMTAILAELGLGLAAFGAGSWIGTLAGAGEALLSFFGVKSPFEKIMEISDKNDEIMKGSFALDRLTSALERFGALKITAPDIDFKGFAASISEAIPLLRAAAEGGTIKVGGFLGIGADTYDFGPKKTPGKGGILDPDLHVSEVIQRVNTYLSAGGPSGNITGLGQESVTQSGSMQVAQQSLNETKTNNYVNQSAGNTTSVASVDNSSSVVNSYYQSGMASPIDASDKASQPLIFRR